MPDEVTVLTDSQLNVALSLYAAKKLRLPVEIALNSDPDYFRQQLRMRFLGIEDNDVICSMMKMQLDSSVAAAIASSASYLDRISHLSGTDIGKAGFTDLTGFYQAGCGRPDAVGTGGPDGRHNSTETAVGCPDTAP